MSHRQSYLRERWSTLTRPGRIRVVGVALILLGFICCGLWFVYNAVISG